MTTTEIMNALPPVSFLGIPDESLTREQLIIAVRAMARQMTTMQEDRDRYAPHVDWLEYLRTPARGDRANG